MVDRETQTLPRKGLRRQLPAVTRRWSRGVGKCLWQPSPLSATLSFRMFSLCPTVLPGFGMTQLSRVS